MRRIRLAVEYDGSGFQGWQIQARGRTVQGVLEAALAEVSGAPTRALAASRTDAGVHARGQVVHLDTDSRLSPLELLRALNALLPHDLAVLEAREASPGFDARRDALSKHYRYRILARASPSPLRRGHTWHRRGALDLDAMTAAACALRGDHDFAAFRGTPGGPPADQETHRTLDRLEVARARDELHVIAQGRSFLRYMVRNLVGTLVEVGQGRLPAEALPEILASRDRARAGPTAPPQGLCLERVLYPDAGDRGCAVA